MANGISGESGRSPQSFAGPTKDDLEFAKHILESKTLEPSEKKALETYTNGFLLLPQQKQEAEEILMKYQDDKEGES